MITNSFDPDSGIIEPAALFTPMEGLPDTCVITFSKTVLEHALHQYEHSLARACPGSTVTSPSTASAMRALKPCCT